MDPYQQMLELANLDDLGIQSGWSGSPPATKRRYLEGAPSPSPNSSAPPERAFYSRS
jgi:hypothetical protein